MESLIYMFTASRHGGYNLCDKSSFLFHVVDDCILKVGGRKRKVGLLWKLIRGVIRGDVVI